MEKLRKPYEVTGLILAGGASRRMGRPKAGLEVGGQPLVDRVLSKVTALCRETILVTRQPSEFLEYPIKIVRDLTPKQGPLGGVLTGLFYARTTWSLIVACDLPFLDGRLLELLITRALAAKPGPRVVVPRTTEGWQPLVAVYSTQCQGPVRRLLEHGGRKVDDLKFHGVNWEDVPEAEMRTIDPDLKSFLNINTPGDLELAESIIKGID